MHCAEGISSPGDVPEDVARRTAQSLLTEIATRGCVPRSHQGMTLFLMALGPEDVGQARLGRLTPQAITMLRDLQHITGIAFQLKIEEQEVQSSSTSSEPLEETLVRCVGCGVRGARKVG